MKIVVVAASAVAVVVGIAVVNGLLPGLGVGIGESVHGK